MFGGDLLFLLIVILIVVFVWRGPKVLPKLGAALGKTVRDLRREAQADDTPPVDPADPTRPGPG
jgi:sec-independent protein translocase protein TatA